MAAHGRAQAGMATCNRQAAALAADSGYTQMYTAAQGRTRLCSHAERQERQRQTWPHTSAHGCARPPRG
eukprot:11168844-Lingulodinium_polyedra.AAC.1